LRARFGVGNFRLREYRDEPCRIGPRFRHGLEPVNFSGHQLSEFSRMNIQFKISVADALDLLDVMSNLFEHAPNLTILAFDQCDLVPGVIGFPDQIHPRGRGLDPSSLFRSDE
jgi:hypothetical protein